MPVRSLNSSVLRWPKRDEVDRAVRLWAAKLVKERPEIIRLGYFGSYARGDWGVGSDLDLVAVVDDCEERFERRSLKWDMRQLPVPAQALVYTSKEWELLKEQGGRFALTLERETIWMS
jgi:predicted nucleotidyltransferase